MTRPRCLRWRLTLAIIVCILKTKTIILPILLLFGRGRQDFEKKNKIIRHTTTRSGPRSVRAGPVYNRRMRLTKITNSIGFTCERKIAGRFLIVTLTRRRGRDLFTNQQYRVCACVYECDDVITGGVYTECHFNR